MLFDTKLIRVLQVLSVSLLLASCGGGDSDTTPAKRTTPTQGVAAALPSSTWTSAPEGSGQQSPAPGTAHSFLHVWDGTSDSVFRIDPNSGTLSPVGTLRFEDVVTSNFVIHPSGKFAYATRTRWTFTGDDYLTAYAINAATGALTPIGAPEAFPWGSYQIAVHPGGGFLYVGPEEVRGPNNYFAYKFRRYAVNPATGTLSFIGESMLSAINPSTDAVRSFKFDPSGKFLYVMLDGGLEPETSQIQQYIVDSASGALTPTTAGSQPWSFRWLSAMTIHPNGKFLYVWCVLDRPFPQPYDPYGEIQTYNIDVTGVLTKADALLKTDGPSSVTVEPSGRFLYTVDPNSGISTYTINPLTGVLASVGDFPVWGPVPGGYLWSLTADPNGKFLYVADPKFSKIYTFAIDPVSGALSSLGVPTSVTFYPYPPGSPYFTLPQVTTLRTIE